MALPELQQQREGGAVRYCKACGEPRATHRRVALSLFVMREISKAASSEANRRRMVKEVSRVCPIVKVGERNGMDVSRPARLAKP